MAFHKQNIQMVPVDEVHILNPRTRNKETYDEIKRNIKAVGLKRPITVTLSENKTDGKIYDLVCGQGRLEAFIEFGLSEIPAIIIEASEERALIMSLVENLARRQHRSTDLLKAIEVLQDAGHSAQEISEKTNLTIEYIREILKLLERGEERLILAVETGKMPLNLAVKIALSPGEEQLALQEAYDSGLLKGNRLLRARKIIEDRRRRGKIINTRHRNKSLSYPRMTGQDVVNIFHKEVERKKALTRKADFVSTQLMFVGQAIKNLLEEDHFRLLLKSENIQTLPKPLGEKWGIDI
mgnify:CR=1 FL=1